VTSADGVRPVYHVLGPLNRSPKELRRRDLGGLDPWIPGVWRLETRISKAGDLRISGSQDSGSRNLRISGSQDLRISGSEDLWISGYLVFTIS